MKKLGQFMDETWRTSAFSFVWFIPTVIFMVRDRSEQASLALTSLSLFGLGVMLGINGKMVKDWIKLNLSLLLCALLIHPTASSASTLESQASASQLLVNDGLAIARGELPQLQMTASVVMGIVYVTATGLVIYGGYRLCRWIGSRTNVFNRQNALDKADQASSNFAGGTCLAELVNVNLIGLHYNAGQLTVHPLDPVELPAPPYGRHYWRDGEEVSAEESPVSFDGGLITVAPGGNHFIVERSTDLVQWERILEADQPSEEFYLEDAFSEQAMFYRVMP